MHRAKSKVAKALAAKWEGSPPDKAQDKREAKKRGKSVKAYEGSAVDEKKDAAAAKKAKQRK